MRFYTNNIIKLMGAVLTRSPGIPAGLEIYRLIMPNE